MENRVDNADNHADNADNHADNCGIAKFFSGRGAARTASTRTRHGEDRNFKMRTRRGTDAYYLPTSSRQHHGVVSGLSRLPTGPKDPHRRPPPRETDPCSSSSTLGRTRRHKATHPRSIASAPGSPTYRSPRAPGTIPWEALSAPDAHVFRWRPPRGGAWKGNIYIIIITGVYTTTECHDTDQCKHM